MNTEQKEKVIKNFEESLKKKSHIYDTIVNEINFGTLFFLLQKKGIITHEEFIDEKYNNIIDINYTTNEVKK